MRRFLLPIATLAASAAGQTQFTSPPTVGADGGSSVSFQQPFMPSSAGRRYQYVVGDVAALPPSTGESLASLAMRPDPTAGASAARTLALDLVLDHTDLTALGTTFGANYSGGETTVLSTPNLNLPATTGGAGFVIALPFATPFVYFGDHHQPGNENALLVEFRTTGVSGGGAYTLDCVDGTLEPQVGTSTYLGLQGCIATPHTTPFDIFKRGPTTAGGSTTCGVYGQRAPLSAIGVLSVGLTDPNSTFGGLLCAPLRAMPDLVALPTPSSATGTIGSAATPLDLVFPDLAATQSARFYTQFAVHDAARVLPEAAVALSDAVQWDITAPESVPRRLLYSNTSAAAATGTLSADFVPVFRFN